MPTSNASISATSALATLLSNDASQKKLLDSLRVLRDEYGIDRIHQCLLALGKLPDVPPEQIYTVKYNLGTNRFAKYIRRDVLKQKDHEDYLLIRTLSFTTYERLSTFTSVGQRTDMLLSLVIPEAPPLSMKIVQQYYLFYLPDYGRGDKVFKFELSAVRDIEEANGLRKGSIQKISKHSGTHTGMWIVWFNQLDSVLLRAGRGFMYIDSQQRIVSAIVRSAIGWWCRFCQGAYHDRHNCKAPMWMCWRCGNRFESATTSPKHFEQHQNDCKKDYHCGRCNMSGHRVNELRCAAAKDVHMVLQRELKESPTWWRGQVNNTPDAVSVKSPSYAKVGSHLFLPQDSHRVPGPKIPAATWKPNDASSRIVSNPYSPNSVGISVAPCQSSANDEQVMQGEHVLSPCVQSDTLLPSSMWDLIDSTPYDGDTPTPDESEIASEDNDSATITGDSVGNDDLELSDEMNTDSNANAVGDNHSEASAGGDNDSEDPTYEDQVPRRPTTKRLGQTFIGPSGGRTLTL
ncbi:hypothetical protein GGR57DRAFT_503607 [Xylariaceae sp. FL1272]|nr:hypothetical protein GGR57DRAFT_503607 [Xylariaceae sp. FL1272]